MAKATPRAAKPEFSSAHADEERETTVLFADVSDSTRLYESAGDKAALRAIGGCIKTLRAATEAAGGRVVKTIGDELMALFSTPDHAADAAERMHTAIEALPEVEGHKLAVRIGFHAGPVIQRDDDIFGDTVNLAARLAEQATRGQVLMSAHTASMLAPALKSATRQLYDITVRGKVEDIALCEFLWQKNPDITNLPVTRGVRRTRRVHLRLRYAGRELVLRRQVEAITLGRDPDCDFVVDDPNASRHHCVIERRQGKFVVRDHSSNGTYVAVQGEPGETLLRREEITLRKHGWISFGVPKDGSHGTLEYWCE